MDLTPLCTTLNRRHIAMHPSVNKKEQREPESIDSHLLQIRSYIEGEIANKQTTIARMQEQLQELTMMALQKDAQLEALQEKLIDCKQMAEGQRQLTNKLLNDISNYQKDIMWYKRTYEHRSLLGLLKDKFFRQSASDNPGTND
jgi:chromosome segregation ATPase